VLRWIGIGVGILTALLIAFVVYATFFSAPGFREGAAAIAIVLLAVFQLVIAVLLIALLIALLYIITRLNQLARTSLIPKMDEVTTKVNQLLDDGRHITGDVRTTVGNATGTTSFVTERLVSPLIRLSSIASGVRAAANSLARRDLPPPGGE
jgi:membrane protein implicated in regulation of membrane protease activity